MKTKGNYVLLMISIVGYVMLSASFFLMPVENNFVISTISGVMFWLGLLIGAIFQGILVRQRKKEIANNRVYRLTNKKIRLGIFALFKNPVAIVFDVLMAVAVIGLICSIVLTDGIGYICYIFLGSTVLTFSMHCIFNGRVYQYIRNKGKKNTAGEEQ